MAQQQGQYSSWSTVFRTLNGVASIPSAFSLLMWGPLAVITLLAALGVSFPLSLQYLCLGLGLLLFGLPHGAIDHLTPFRVLRRPITVGWMALWLTAYIGLAAIFGLSLLSAPTVALAALLVMTWVHWGQGDVAYLLRVTRVQHLEKRFDRQLAVFNRGALPMVLPLVFYPDVLLGIGASIAQLLGQESIFGLNWLVQSEVRLGLWVLVAAATITYLFRTQPTYLGFTRRAHIRWWIDAGELILLWFFFTLVPPMLALGLYFALWHALRHIVRAIVEQRATPTDRRQGRWGRWALHFGRDALVPTAVVILVLIAAVIVVPTATSSFEHLTGLYLVVLAALTLPHFLLWLWADAKTWANRDLGDSPTRMSR